MNKFLSVLGFLFTINFFAQIPTGYYNTATGTGYVLKTQLYNIIKDHNDRGYSGLYVTYTTSDIDLYYENNGTMLDMYTENPNGPDNCEYTYGINQDDGTQGTAECQKYNREHIIPQSVFDSNTPMYSDAHFVVPSDKYVNAQRGNLPFGKVGTSSVTTYSNGSKKGNNLNSGYSAGYSSMVFEPIDEFKGDIARMIFYFATRYEDQVAGWSFDMFNGTSNQVFTPTFKNILLTWNALDVVSQREIDRNNAIYNRQNNRNPYIDHPEWVNAVWGTVAAVDEFEDIAFEVYPNPAKEVLFVKTKFDDTIIGYDIFTIYGEKITSDSFISNNSIPLNDLNSGVYFLQIHTSDNSFTQKFIIQ